MNAVMRKYDRVEGTDMETNENGGLGELRSDVRHIQSDVTDIKADLQITNQRIESLRRETGEKIDKLDQKIDQKIEKLDQKFEAKFDKVDSKFESLRKEIVEIRESLGSAKVWALWLYLGLAGSLFYVLARGFKWI
jgi:chromosome segregation ATPase